MTWIKDVNDDFINTDFVDSISLSRCEIRAYYGEPDENGEYTYHTIYEDEDADQNLLKAYMKYLDIILGII